MSHKTRIETLIVVNPHYPDFTHRAFICSLETLFSKRAILWNKNLKKLDIYVNVGMEFVKDCT